MQRQGSRARLGLSIIAVGAIALATLVARDIAADRRTAIKITGPTPLLAARPRSAGEETRMDIIGVLQPGVPVKVLRVRYGKDIMALRVESTLGTGWIIYNSRNVTVQRPVGMRV